MHSTDFGGLRIEYDDTMLVPRAWTIAQSEWAAELLASVPAGPVLELCAGAGHIGLAAVRGSGRSWVAVDDNPSACAHLRRNAERAGLGHLVDVRAARLDRALAPEERFALVIADPPWVARGGIDAFPEDPAHTIDGGESGLEVARQCLDVVARHLLPGGAAILQLGSTEQVEAVASGLPAHLQVSAVRRHGDRGVLARLDAVGAGLRARREAGTGR
ncbi:MAG: RsmD family RNA methyltransferase [Marmoricola sp.]